MWINCFRQTKVGGVLVLSMDKINIDVEYILQKGRFIRNPDVIDFQDVKGFQGAERVDIYSKPLLVGEISFKFKGKIYSQPKSFVAFYNPDDLINFLISYYSPRNIYPIDFELKKMEKLTKAEKYKKLKKLLFEQDYQDYPYYSSSFSHYTYLPARMIERQSIDELIIGSQDFFVKKEKFLIAAGSIFPREKFLSIFHQKATKVKSVNIPITSFLVMGGEIYSRAENRFVVVDWDSKNLKVSALDERRGLELVRGKFQNGYVGNGNFDFLPKPAATIECIIRVPSKNEVNEDVDKIIKMRPKIKKPLFFIETWTLKEEQIKSAKIVLDSPYEVLPILARIQDNIFVPEDQPVKPVLGEQAYFLGGITLL